MLTLILLLLLPLILLLGLVLITTLLILRAVLILLVILMLTIVLLRVRLLPIPRVIATIRLGKLLRHLCRTALQVYVHPSCIVLSRVLQAQFLAYLFDLRFDLLDMAWRVVTLSHNPACASVLCPWMQSNYRLTRANGSDRSPEHI